LKEVIKVEKIQPVRGYVSYLPYITDSLWEEFNETDLMTWDKQTNRPHWTQTAVDFSCALPITKKGDVSGEVNTKEENHQYWHPLNEMVSDYIDGYEFRGDGDYSPNKEERLLIEDCVCGLLEELPLGPQYKVVEFEYDSPGTCGEVSAIWVNGEKFDVKRRYP
jgi:hypothetical protein